MMTSPDGYVNQFKDKSIEEIIKERDNLIRSIRRFEKKYIFKTVELTKKEQDEIICPSPDTVYQVELDYLSEISKLLCKKYSNSVYDEDYELEDEDDEK